MYFYVLAINSNATLKEKVKMQFYIQRNSPVFCKRSSMRDLGILKNVVGRCRQEQWYYVSRKKKVCYFKR